MSSATTHQTSLVDKVTSHAHRYSWNDLFQFANSMQEELVHCLHDGHVSGSFVARQCEEIVPCPERSYVYPCFCIVKQRQAQAERCPQVNGPLRLRGTVASHVTTEPCREPRLVGEGRRLEDSMCTHELTFTKAVMNSLLPTSATSRSRRKAACVPFFLSRTAT